MAAVPQPTLEERVAALEKIVAQLVRPTEPPPRFKDWRRAIGMFPGNELMN